MIKSIKTVIWGIVTVFCLFSFNMPTESDSFIIVGRLHVIDTTSRCQNNSIVFNDKNIVNPDKNGYFKIKFKSSSCSITKISNFEIGKYWRVEKLSKDSVNYIGDIDVVLAPNRSIVYISSVYYSSNNNDAMSQSEDLYGPNSDYSKWYQENCYDPSWDKIKQQGYYYSAPKSISRNEIIKFSISDNFEETTQYFRTKSKKSIFFIKNLLASNNND